MRYRVREHGRADAGRGYHDGMTAITIDLPEHVRDELAARAERQGRSLQEYLRERLGELAEGPDPDDVFARARERARAGMRDVSEEEIVEILREIRGA
jgi:hypothetical protein